MKTPRFCGVELTEVRPDREFRGVVGELSVMTCRHIDGDWIADVRLQWSILDCARSGDAQSALDKLRCQLLNLRRALEVVEPKPKRRGKR